MNNKFLKKYYFSICLLLITTYGCKKDISLGEKVEVGEEIQIEVSADIQNFPDYTIKTSNNGSVNYSMINNYPKSYTTTTSISNDLEILAELTPITNNTQIKIQTFNFDNQIIHRKNIAIANAKSLRAASNLQNDVKYKLIVFDEFNNYITERDYTYKNESVTPGLILGINKEYTFVAISLNSTTEMPSYEGPNTGKNLSNCNVVIQGNKDLLFYKKKVIITPTTAKLGVIFKHQFNRIKTSIDASVTEYELTNIVASITSYNNKATLNFQSGAISRSALTNSQSLNFSISNFFYANSQEIFVNAAPNESLLTIQSLTIGPLTQSNYVPFPSGVSLTPGYSYELKLTVSTKDTTFVNGYQGQPAVRINGQVWMRHNIGVNTSLNPDNINQNIQLHGNYYQFGQNNIFFPRDYNQPSVIGLNGYPNSSNPVNWIFNSNASTLKWNGNSNTANTIAGVNQRESNPSRGTNDPCPANFRVPTMTEFLKLEQGILVTTEGSGTYGTFTILTSKRKKSVKLTIPAQGYMTVFYNPSVSPTHYYNGVDARGSGTILSTSTLSPSTADNSKNYRVIALATSAFEPIPEDLPVALMLGSGNPMRCIAVNSTL